MRASRASFGSTSAVRALRPALGSNSVFPEPQQLHISRPKIAAWQGGRQKNINRAHRR